ncbi:MAG: 2-oxoglutarate dehydrogenase E1 component [Alphaproteobacteria bacterium]|nr:2-oxoglutarate dehydrogenase E1 component [Alphaproteobacteria bacterium]
MVTQIDPASFLTGGNATFVAELYAQYLSDPQSVDASWIGFFESLRRDGVVVDDLDAAQWGRMRASVIERNGHLPGANGHALGENGHAANGSVVTAEIAASAAQVARATMGSADPAAIRAATLDSIRALMMIRAYRVRGHLYAKLDPLGRSHSDHHPELDYKTYGFTDADLDRPIFIDHVLGMETATLRQILDALERTYCNLIGVEFMHMQDPDQKFWIQQRIEEPRNQTEFTDLGKRTILERLTEAETFEQFLDKRYVGTKRFGLEGGESLIPAMEQIIKRGSQLGMEELVVGMAHRGRLSVLANVMGKPFTNIFSEFQGNAANPEDVQGSGDVKYHLGTSSDREFDGKVVHLSLTPNPSHLETADPVVIGKVRAKQEQKHDTAREKVVACLLHGDAAFIGQGVVAETFLLSDLKGYRVGGTIHVVINNQIGFTTSPTDSRGGQYCTDLARSVMAPILHVNGDDPEAVVHAARICTEFRYQFKKDVVLDMYCYRRQGHNEADEPSFTQPDMYRTIAKHQTTRKLYAKRLVDEGLLSQDEVDGMEQNFRNRLEQDFEAAKNYKPNKADWLEGAWSGLDIARGEDRRGETAVDLETIREIARNMTRVPEDFHINRKIARQFDHRRASVVETGEGIDWATGEALAFGAVLVEGTPVRLSGQDCGRGTFSQRHAVLTDQENETKYVPLANLREGQGRFEIIDSPLAEYSVLGFEYGYTQSEPHALVMWEAQFGDFANGAQVMIDTYIAAAETKWLRMSGIVMLLPHGYEGQGPEHSSARLERYLQLCAEDNIQVCAPTTPANYFHMLRRQVRRNFRKPLIVMTPKSLLRHKACVSDVEEFGPGTSFHRVIAEHRDLVAGEHVKRIVLCSGKVYYDLLQRAEEAEVRDVALVRVEQLYPFPQRSLTAELVKYPNADVVWCQEEPRNMGAWHFVDRRIEEVLAAIDTVDMQAKRPRFIGRPDSAATATGLLKRHLAEQAKLVDEALMLA